MGLHIERIYGKAPVQAEGTLDGLPFYFRARWDGWSFGLSLDGRDPVDVQMPEQGFYREGCYGKEFDASYLPEAEVRRMIEKCARQYQAQKRKLFSLASFLKFIASVFKNPR